MMGLTRLGQRRQEGQQRQVGSCSARCTLRKWQLGQKKRGWRANSRQMPWVWRAARALGAPSRRAIMISFQASSASTLNSSMLSCSLFWMLDIFAQSVGTNTSTLSMAPMLSAIARVPATVVDILHSLLTQTPSDLPFLRFNRNIVALFMHTRRLYAKVWKF